MKEEEKKRNPLYFFEYNHPAEIANRELNKLKIDIDIKVNGKTFWGYFHNPERESGGSYMSEIGNIFSNDSDITKAVLTFFEEVKNYRQTR